MSQAGTLTTSGGSGGSGVNTLTGNDAIAVSPVANNINVLTSNATAKFLSSAGTETINFRLTNLVLGSSLPSLTSGTLNVGLGFDALKALTSGSANTGIGYNALLVLTTGVGNVALGENTLLQAVSTSSNTAIGTSALNSLVSGVGENVAVGLSALEGITTGTNNIGIGTQSGFSNTGSDSSNIYIGNTGAAGESNTIRIGTQGAGAGQQNRAFMAGIVGVTVANPVITTINSSTGQMGVVASANSGTLITSNTGVPSFLANGTTGQVLTATTAQPPSWQNASNLNITKTAVSYNVLVTDDYVGITSTASARTMSLITANYAARQSWIFKDESLAAATNNITITPSTGTIDNAASYVINSNGGSIQLIFDGTNYWVY